MDIMKNTRGKLKLTLITAEANIRTMMNLSTSKISEIGQGVALVETKSRSSNRRSNVSQTRVCSLKESQ